MKTMLKAAALSASLIAVVAVTTSAQAGFYHAGAKRTGHPAHAADRHHGKDHGHHRRHHHGLSRRFVFGYPDNCRQFRKRAYLTGNAYWRYAAHRCRSDWYYKD